MTFADFCEAVLGKPLQWWQRRHLSFVEDTYMPTQTFHRGDLVHIAKDLGPSMSHFTADTFAIVIGSYADKFGGGNTKSYTLHVAGEGQTSWYEEHQLTLIEKNRLDLLAQWEETARRDHEEKSDLDWIFAHGTEVAEHGYGASIEALAACYGLDDLWGSRGEGFVYAQNALRTLEVAQPFLIAGDKAGWLAKAEEIKAAL